MTLLVTVTLYEHVMPAGTTPALKLSVVPPAVAESVPVQPAPVMLGLGVAALNTFAGYVSVNATPLSAIAFELFNVMVSTDVAPTAMGLGTKLSATVSVLSRARTPAGAMTMPTPESRSIPTASMSSAEFSNAVLTCALVAVSLADLIKPAMAAAWGAAAEVPQNGSKPVTKECVQSAAVRSTLASVVPPLVPNNTLPGVIAAPAGV